MPTFCAAFGCTRKGRPTKGFYRFFLDMIGSWHIQLNRQNCYNELRFYYTNIKCRYNSELTIGIMDFISYYFADV